MFEDAPTAASSRLILASISRALWFNDANLANRILNFSEVARGIISVTNGKVFCFDPAYFDELFNETHKDHQGRILSGLRNEITKVSSANLKNNSKED